MSAMRVVLAAALLFGLAAAQGPWINGLATHTGVPVGVEDADFVAPKSVPNGACGYGTLNATQYPNFLLAGIGSSNPLAKPMGGCGTCLEIKCSDADLCESNTPVTVMVYDSCKDCSATQINMYATAFSRFAPLEAGRVGIQYRPVACPFTGGIVLNIDTYRSTSGGYIKLSLKNVAGASPITSVQLAKAGSDTWRDLNNKYGAVWEKSTFTTPLDLKITNANNQSVVLRSVITKDTQAGDLATATNFKA